jgi:hypothetical protein
MCKMCMFYMYIVILLSLVFFKTVAIFSATYTRQQLGRSLQKSEKLVTVCLARSNFAPIHLPRRNTPAYGTHHLCVAILTTRHILTLSPSGLIGILWWSTCVFGRKRVRIEYRRDKCETRLELLTHQNFYLFLNPKR